MVWSVCLLGHRQKPSWCLQVRMRPFIPEALMASTHWSAFMPVGLKMAGFSVPSPHSLSVKVFTVKCTKA